MLPAATVAKQSAICGRPSRIGSTCLEQLAAGSSVPADLCPQCTSAFITALDGIAGPMAWHPDFRNRASR